jgi:Pyruvate/2-oxoacid:ferredoxin oxidoreductase delta subunit
MAAKGAGLWDDLVPIIDASLCRRCAECAAEATCTVHALRRAAADAVPAPDAGFCLGCYACAAACPHRAIRQPKRG